MSKSTGRANKHLPAIHAGQRFFKMHTASTAPLVRCRPQGRLTGLERGKEDSPETIAMKNMLRLTLSTSAEEARVRKEKHDKFINMMVARRNARKAVHQGVQA